MADLGPAKDIIKGLPKGIQAETISQLNERLAADQADEAREAVDVAVEEILRTTPDMTIEDGNQLQTWQERRTAGKPVAP